MSQHKVTTETTGDSTQVTVDGVLWMSIVDGRITIRLAHDGVYVEPNESVNGMSIAPYHPRSPTSPRNFAISSGWSSGSDGEPRRHRRTHGHLEDLPERKAPSCPLINQKRTTNRSAAVRSHGRTQNSSTPRSFSLPLPAGSSSHSTREIPPPAAASTLKVTAMAHPQLTVETVDGSTQATSKVFSS